MYRQKYHSKKHLRLEKTVHQVFLSPRKDLFNLFNPESVLKKNLKIFHSRFSWLKSPQNYVPPNPDVSPLVFLEGFAACNYYVGTQL